MLKSKFVSLISALGAGAVILLAQGCGHVDQDTVNHADRFTPEVETRETTRLANTQQAAGTREDSTLYPQHFDGGELSSLGAYTLDSILHDSASCDPLVVYMAVPEDSLAMSRRLAVGNYLMDRGGLRPEQIKFVAGPNPSTYHLSSPDIVNYNKTDTGVSSSSDTAAPQHS